MENIVWENDWTKYMAMDCDGEWWEYEKRPYLNKFFMDYEKPSKIGKKKIIPNGKIDWKYSIIKRERKESMNSKIKITQRYKTTDGSLFRDREEAEERQRLLDLVDFLYNEDFQYFMHDKEAFKKAIFENSEKLKEIMEGK